MLQICIFVTFLHWFKPCKAWTFPSRISQRPTIIGSLSSERLSELRYQTIHWRLSPYIMEIWMCVTFFTHVSNLGRHGCFQVGSNGRLHTNCRPVDGALAMHAIYNHSIPTQNLQNVDVLQLSIINSLALASASTWRISPLRCHKLVHWKQVQMKGDAAICVEV